MSLLPSQNPYPGLRPYQAIEQTKFYGRDVDKQILLEKILANRLTLLFAATGVGKSSLLQAAILPKLSSDQGLKLDVVYYNDWIAPPIQGLQAAIRAALITRYGSLPNINETNLETFFRSIGSYTTKPLVVILDQFEEFFRYRFIHHAADFQPFIDQLSELILAPELNISLVFSMREDFALELNAFKPHLPNPLFGHYYRLEKLGAESARQAIIEPLIQAGYHAEPELLDQLLTDLLSRDLTRDASSLAKGTQADSVEPPYLQIVCSQLWELDKNDAQKTLRLATYNKASGAKGLLENYVNYVIKSFSDREKQVASKAFDHLISRRGTKMAHTPEDLAELVNHKPAEVANVMDKLEKARILRRQQRDQQVWYELYHDMFSGGIESWNAAWKNHMRLRRTLIATGASLAALAAIYFGVIAYLQGTSKHLRLGNGNKDRVEIYTGTSKFPDPFGQQHYFSETSFEREQLELDKRYTKRDIPDYPSVVRDLIGSQRLYDRIGLYIANGEFCQFSDLLTQVISIDKPAPACKLNTFRQRVTNSSNNSSKTAENKPNSSSDDPMFSTMITSLPELKTAWSLEQQITFAKNEKKAVFNVSNTLEFPIKLDKNQLIDQVIADPNTAVPLVDPRQIELILEWILDPTPFTVTQNHPVQPDLATLLRNGSLVLAVMQSMPLKPRLLQVLASDNAKQREMAVILSGILADPDLFEPLAHLLDEKSTDLREAVLKSLVSIDAKQAVPLVETIVKDQAQPNDLRSSLVTLLSDTQSVKAAPTLLALFQDIKEREYIRMYAGRILGQFGYVSALPSLQTVLGNMNERNEARLGAIEGIEALSDQASIRLLIERMNDPEERLDIRIACARALEGWASNESKDTLFSLIENPMIDDSLKQAAISSLVFTDDPIIINKLIAFHQNLPSNSYLLSSIESDFATSENPILKAALKNAPISLSSYIPTETERLTTEVSYNIKKPQYKPMNSSEESTALNDINARVPSIAYLEAGTYEQRQALSAALNMKEAASRNTTLARLALDETITLNTRLRALAGIVGTSTSESIQALHKLAQHTNWLIRTSSINALLRVEEGKNLLPWLSNTEIALEQQAAGLARFAATSSRSEAITTLLSIAKDDSKPLQAKAYQLLGDLKAVEALPVLEKNLATLSHEYQMWRDIRDRQPLDTSDEAVYQDWQQKLAASLPAHARLATHYGYAVAQIDFKKGLAALAHDLADVRTGAGLAFNKSATPDALQLIATARQEQRDNPLFQQSSYLALDKALVRLETTTNTQEIKALETWQSQLLDKNDPVSQRLDWTLTMIKHYQKLDQEFAEKYHLKRSL